MTESEAPQRLESWKGFPRRLAAALPNLDLGLMLLLLIFSYLLLYRLGDPDGALIFDETYYVQDARVMLGHLVTSEGLPEKWYSGGDPNAEHPVLAKFIIAQFISVFQANGTGWRLPSVALGVVSVGMVYGIALALGASRNQARLAAAILAFDNMFFIHSRIATLDIYLVGFSLLGTWLYFRKHYELAGIAFGLATCSKINGMFSVAAIVAYEILSLWRCKPERSPFTRKPLVLLLTFYAAFTFFLMGALDCYWTQFRTPTEHVVHIFRYGASLVREKGVAPQGVESTPLQWWMNDKAFDYFAITTSVEGNTANPIRFQGRLSNYIISAAPFALLFCLVHGWRGNRMAILVLCLFFFNYAPVFASWALARRICYLYYMVPCLPAIVLGISLGLKSMPGWFRYSFVASVLYSFVYLFPFKD